MTKWRWLLLLGVFVSTPVHAEREITIGFQGVVASKDVDTAASATGLFKFVLCDKDCITSFWSNDGTSVTGSEPTASVSIPVIKGVFSILLGDTAVPMAAIPLTVFEDLGDKDLYLRVWYSDGVEKFEQFNPDQKMPFIPYAARAEMIGSFSQINSITMKGDLNSTGGVSVEGKNITSSSTLFKVEGTTKTLFTINGDGTATSRSFDLKPLTAASEISRLEAGRVFYDGNLNKFMGCNDTKCAEIGLAGTAGVADITSITAGVGLSGGGLTGDLDFTLDPDVVVTKTGNHTMAGTLSADSFVAPTISATTLNIGSMIATGALTANSLNVITSITSLGAILSPTGTALGNTGGIHFQELAATGTNTVGFKSPDSILTTKVWALPIADGAPGQILKTDGLAGLGWAEPPVGIVTAVTTGLGLIGGASTGDADVAAGVLGGGVTAIWDADCGADFSHKCKLQIDLISDAGGEGEKSNFSGMEFGGASELQFGLLQGCTNNQILRWNDTTAMWECGTLTAPTETVTDSTPYGALPNGVGSIAEVMNSGEPSIVPDKTTNRIWVNGTILLYANGIDEETSTFRIYRKTVDDASCSGTQVGVDLPYTSNHVGNFSVPFSFIDSPTSTAAQFYTVCGYTDTATTPNDVTTVMLTIQEVPPAGADLAELYPTIDKTIQAGTVVSLDPNLSFGVQKSSRDSASAMLGVISTDPGLLLDDGVGVGSTVPVALYGRVPVQVTTHDGADPIHVGDYLTLSEIPGVAMKAKKSGAVIGKAISRLESGSGNVFMFIEQGYFNVRDESLTGRTETDSSGLATVTFTKPMGTVKPAVQLTVEKDSLVFAQIKEYLQDALGNTTGFVIKTFAPTGAIVPKVMVHHRVMGSEGSHG